MYATRGASKCERFRDPTTTRATSMPVTRTDQKSAVLVSLLMVLSKIKISLSASQSCPSPNLPERGQQLGSRRASGSFLLRCSQRATAPSPTCRPSVPGRQTSLQAKQIRAGTGKRSEDAGAGPMAGSVAALTVEFGAGGRTRPHFTAITDQICLNLQAIQAYSVIRNPAPFYRFGVRFGVRDRRKFIDL